MCINEAKVRKVAEGQNMKTEKCKYCDKTGDEHYMHGGSGGMFDFGSMKSVSGNYCPEHIHIYHEEVEKVFGIAEREK